DRPDHRRRDRVRDPLQRAPARGRRFRHRFRVPGGPRGHRAHPRADVRRDRGRAHRTGARSVREGRKGAGADLMAEYKVSTLDDLDYFTYKETLTGRVRHELGITAFGVNSWLGKNVGDRVTPEQAEDQEGDQDELYVVVRGRARFEVNDDTFDAPE